MKDEHTFQHHALNRSVKEDLKRLVAKLVHFKAALIH